MDDLPALATLIAISARELSRDDYTGEQIEAALGSAWGIDTQLIADGTYFVVETDRLERGQPESGAGETHAAVVVACGGWSYRKTLFGADGQVGREPEVIDPEHDAARVRAFFVHPAWARRGLGRSLLELCEQRAREHGYRATELVATLPGVRLYQAFGYRPIEGEREGRVAYPLPGGGSIDFVPMCKRL
jgi:GNAT superfamily N-acetyltransferase